jgi:ferritin
MKKPEKLSKEVVDLLLQRLKDEYTAFYMYRSASNWCQEVGFFKAAAFFAAESTDELEHAKGIEKYITDWNVIPELPVVDKPELKFDSISSLVEKAYNLEYELYENYEETSAKVFKMGELCTFDFLQTYRNIQNKSVAEYSDKLNILEGVNLDSKFEMLMIESNLFG